MKHIEVRTVDEWNCEDIRQLYRAGGWWKEEWDPQEIMHIISGSLVFAVGIDQDTGNAIAMARVISDGVSDAYIQDLVVLQEYRGLGIGRRLLASLISESKMRGISWIGLIAEPGTEKFYTAAGFIRMHGYVPMILHAHGNGEEDVIEK